MQSLGLPIGVLGTQAQGGMGEGKKSALELGSLKSEDKRSLFSHGSLGSGPVLSQCTGVSHFSFLKSPSSSVTNLAHRGRG